MCCVDRLKSQTSPVGPTFGAGALSVSNGNQLAGSYEAKGIQPDPTAPRPELLNCDLDGTVMERVQIDIAIECSDASGPVWDVSATLLYSPRYDQGSSLDTIAGNYTLPFNTATNMLNINNDGVVFGMYHNGPNCTVNGQVSLVDPLLNLYLVEWTFANCVFPFPQYDGGQLTGVAVMNPSPLAPPDSFYLLLTGDVDGEFRSISVQYEPP